MSSWRRGVRLWFAEHRARSARSEFSDPKYWEAAYKHRRVPEDWFVDPVQAGRAAKAAYDSFGLGPPISTRKRKPPPATATQTAEELDGSITALHVGCGLSLLGNAVVAAFRDAPRVRSVLNVDSSEAALMELQERQEGKAFRPEQNFMNYDLGDVNAWFKELTFDLILDKGTLDAMQFGSERQLVNYFAILRKSLKPGGLYVHWSDEKPEMGRSDLLRAAFPTNEGYAHTFTLEEPAGHLTRNAQDPSIFGWEFFRYAVAFQPPTDAESTQSPRSTSSSSSP